MKEIVIAVAMMLVWPFPSGKDYHMQASPQVPAAAGTVHATRDKDNHNTDLDIKVDHLAKPSNLTPSESVYILWVRPNDGNAMKMGAIGVGGDLKGEVHSTTTSRDFDVLITAEQSEGVTSPSGPEVLHTHVSM